MNAKKQGLGRGLSAIFELENINTTGKTTVSSMEEIEVAAIVPNPMQPRTYFNEDSLEELADSIRALGVIQPVTVKKGKEGKYMIIS